MDLLDLGVVRDFLVLDIGADNVGYLVELEGLLGDVDFEESPSVRRAVGRPPDGGLHGGCAELLELCRLVGHHCT